MNRTSLHQAVASRTDEPLGIVELIVDTALAEIVSATERGETVQIDGFGRWLRERIGTRPGHPAYNAVRFNACHGWRERLNPPPVETRARDAARKEIADADPA